MISRSNSGLERAENNVRQYQRNPEAASTYGWVLSEMGRLDDAEKWLQYAVSSGQVSPDTAYYLCPPVERSWT